MKIKSCVLKDILDSIPNHPPEIGGILGGKDGIITQCYIDCKSSSLGCYYSPDIISLDKIIFDWQKDNISFMGIFHTHFGGAKTLSDGDKIYISKIMQAMPERLNKLYFPVVVMPEKTMIPYLANRCEKSVEIITEQIVIK